MPKRVDPVARRTAIAEAVFRVAADRGLEAVGLRDVAAEAGVSLGMVQHYFGSKDEMLLFALDHMRERVAARLQARVGNIAGAAPRDLLQVLLTELLPITPATRAEAIVSVAFYSRAAAVPAYATALHTGLANLLDTVTQQLRAAERNGQLKVGANVEQEATTLLWLTHGLVGPLLVGPSTPEGAQSLLGYHLDRIFK